jgi:hypothetical protein
MTTRLVRKLAAAVAEAIVVAEIGVARAAASGVLVRALVPA